MTTTSDLPAVGERTNPRQKFGFYQYYRLANGWITTGPAPALAEAQWKGMGHTPLPEYGLYTLEQLGDNRRPVMAHRFHHILRLGGAKEFSVEQIIESGWHVKPPIPGVTFPQLEGVEIGHFACPMCPNRPFYTEKGLRQHTQVMHASKSEMDALALAIRESVQATPRPAGGESIGTKYQCGCGWEPKANAKNPRQALAMHKRTHEGESI